jgi:hypothetical protein
MGDVTTIRANCPTCGDVELTIHEVTVRVCSADSKGAYSFRCPTCRVVVTKPAESKIVDLLLTAGVAHELWSLPAELFERPDGDPITHDDLLDFHARLQQPGWFDDLLSLTNEG